MQSIRLLAGRCPAIRHVCRPNVKPRGSVRWARTKATQRSYEPLPQGWEAVIGVEVHAQLKAKRKLFSRAQTPDDRVGSHSAENTCVSSFDAALPGTLPGLQSEPLQLALRACLALGCDIGKVITFDRKHYFYPDLTSGFQITQRYSPLAKDGRLPLSFDDGHLPTQEEETDVRIEQIQMEQDTAKSAHHTSETAGQLTTVDLNRAGSGLIEIVSGPDMRTPEQAGAYVRKLREILRRIGASDGNMDEGSLRCDVNVSVHRSGEPWGVRCEVKNLNSVRFVMNAVVHEMHRQQKLLSAGASVEQETRGYNEAEGTTFRLRSKEDSPDYRFMPDPNLPPLRLQAETIAKVRDQLPELPDAQRKRLMKQYGVGLRETNVLMRIGLDDDSEASMVRTSDAVSYFEYVARKRDGQAAMNWVIQELLKALNAQGMTFAANPVRPEDLGHLLDLVQDGKVTKATARALLSELISTHCSILKGFRDDQKGNAVKALLESRNALALDSGEALTAICQEVIEALPDAVTAVRNGNQKVLQRLVGEVMRRTGGRANAKLATEILGRMVQAG